VSSRARLRDLPQQVTAGVSTAAAAVASTASTSSPTAGTSTALPRPVTCPVVEAAGAPAATTNLVLASGDEMSNEEYVSFGTAPTRVEAQVSSSSNPQRPDDQFFQTLAEVYNDAAFEAVIPWTYEHFASGASFALDGRRDPTYLRGQWSKLSHKFETAFHRFTRSGVNDVISTI
jgi:hypothetical protein